MTIEQGFPSPDQPDKGRTATYRAGSRRELWLRALCATVGGRRGGSYATVGGSRGEPSGESRFKVIWEMSVDCENPHTHADRHSAIIDGLP